MPRSLSLTAALVATLTLAPSAAALTRAGSISTTSPVLTYAPGTYDPPAAPTSLYVTSRTDRAVGLSWRNGAGATTVRVRRSVNGGAWATVLSVSAPAAGTFTQWTDSAAVTDAENCYVVQALNSNGSSSSSRRCAFTRDGRDLDVRRLQLRVRVADVSGGGTDDEVEVRLQSPGWLEEWRPAGNAGWVDTVANNDFDRGVDRTYELLKRNVGVVSDITMITLAKDEGDDDLCVAELELVLNQTAPYPGQTVFRRSWGDGACVWVRRNAPLTIPFAELRSSPDWQALRSTQTPNGIDGEWFRAQIEASFADETHGTGSRLGGGPLTVRFVNEDQLRVTVPLWVDASLFGEVQTDVHFNLNLENHCSGDGATTVTLTSTDVDADSWFEDFPVIDIVTAIVGAPLLWYISDNVEDSIDVESVIEADTPGCSIGFGFTQDGGLGLVPR